jgi:hypothetical protein
VIEAICSATVRGQLRLANPAHQEGRAAKQPALGQNGAPDGNAQLQDLGHAGGFGPPPLPAMR